jgi:hypothetical protein
MTTRYSATIRFLDGNTRHNGIATDEALSAWLARYGVQWSAADGRVVAFGPACGVGGVDIESFDLDAADQ